MILANQAHCTLPAANVQKYTSSKQDFGNENDRTGHDENDVTGGHGHVLCADRETDERVDYEYRCKMCRL